jgi:hypothetical protein
LHLVDNNCCLKLRLQHDNTIDVAIVDVGWLLTAWDLHAQVDPGLLPGKKHLQPLCHCI